MYRSRFFLIVSCQFIVVFLIFSTVNYSLQLVLITTVREAKEYLKNKRIAAAYKTNRMVVVVDVTTLEMARKPVKLQKESPAGCVGEGKQSKGN